MFKCPGKLRNGLRSYLFRNNRAWIYSWLTMSQNWRLRFQVLASYKCNVMMTWYPQWDEPTFWNSPQHRNSWQRHEKWCLGERGWRLPPATAATTREFNVLLACGCHTKVTRISSQTWGHTEQCHQWPMFPGVRATGPHTNFITLAYKGLAHPCPPATLWER